MAAGNLVGMVMCNTGSATIPFGGKQRMLGTNPIAIAAPRKGGKPPVFFDGSTSVVAGFKLQVLAAKGLQAPAGWILDKNGEPSTEPVDYFDGGALLIAILPEAFMPLDDYLAQVEVACETLKKAPRRDPAQEVLLPGEPERIARREREAKGIPVPDATWKSLRDLAEGLGVAVT